MNNKFQLLDFYASWCGPCKVLSKVLEEVVILYSDLEITKCDVEENEDLTESYKITNIPVLILKKNDKVIDKKVGVLGKQEICDWLDKYLK